MGFIRDPPFPLAGRQAAFKYKHELLSIMYAEWASPMCWNDISYLQTQAAEAWNTACQKDEKRRMGLLQTKASSSTLTKRGFGYLLPIEQSLKESAILARQFISMLFSIDMKINPFAYILSNIFHKQCSAKAMLLLGYAWCHTMYTAQETNQSPTLFPGLLPITELFIEPQTSSSSVDTCFHLKE